MNIKSLKLYAVNENVYVAAESIEKAIQIFETKHSGFETVPEIEHIERFKIDDIETVLVATE